MVIVLLNSKARLYTGSDEELEANLDYERGDSRFWKIDIVNIGLHFILKNVRPYAASCSEA